MESPGTNDSLGKMFRIGPRIIPVRIRKIKMGIPVFLKKNSPAKPIMIIPATKLKMTDVSVFGYPPFPSS